MTWLIELLFDSIRVLCAQFIVDMMDAVNSVFTDLLSCGLSLFEELFSVAGVLYSNVILPLSIALLFLICAWQLLKTMFGQLGSGAEEPVELVGRSLMCLFMIVFSKRIVDYLLDFAGTPYSWIMGTNITVASFSEFVSAAELATAALGIDTLSIQLLMLILQFVVAWNYFKLLFVIAERYMLLGVFTYTAPLAFSTGGSKATNHILSSWAKIFGGQILLIILDAWGLKMYLSAYGNMMASGHGFTKFFVCCLCLIGFCKILQKLDSYLSSLGLNLGRTTPGMSGTALAVMAGRLLGQAAGHGQETSAYEQRNNERRAEDLDHEFIQENATIPMSGMANSSVNTESERKNAENAGIRMPAGESASASEQVLVAQEHSEGMDNTGIEETTADSGIVSGYDQESWQSLEEEAAALDAAIPEEHFAEEPVTSENYDTGIQSCAEEVEGKWQDSIGCEGPFGDVSKMQESTAKEDYFGAGADIVMNQNAKAPVNALTEAGISPITDGMAEAAPEAMGIRASTIRGTGTKVGGQNISERTRTSAGIGTSVGDRSFVDSGNAVAGKSSEAASDGRKESFVQGSQLFLSADAYEEPGIPFTLETRDGRSYYAVPKEAREGRVEAYLKEDGSLQIAKVQEGGWEPVRKAAQEETSVDTGGI